MSIISPPSIRSSHGPSVLDEYGLTPLARAVFDNKIERVRFLISQGVSLEEPMRVCPTALFVAVELKRHDIAAVLLRAGASTRSRSELERYSPLHLATALGDVKMAQLLIAYGANMYALDRIHATPIVVAVEVGCDEILEFFVHCGAELEFLAPFLNLVIFQKKLH